ncbi:MAG: rhodanese-like domain-containing protein, partial [Rhodanobacter sp.]
MSESLNRDAWLEALRERVPEVSPAQALVRQAQGDLLIDVREDGERASGSPAQAVGLSRGFLELRIEQIEADRRRPLMMLCGSGQRSLLAAETLQRMGY